PPQPLLSVFLVVVRRRGVELPAMLVPLDDLVAAFQLLVVFVREAECFADLLDAVLVGRQVVAAGSLAPAEVGVLPVRVEVAAGDGRRHAAVLVQAPVERLAAAARGAPEAVPIERWCGAPARE